MRSGGRGEAGSRELESVDRASVIVRARPAGGGGAWVTLEDVTELQRLRRIRSEFIDNLSHELRTPLANVRLLTEMLMDDLEREEVSTRVRERVATIDVETGHLVQMVNELLDLSRIEQAATPIRSDEVAAWPHSWPRTAGTPAHVRRAPGRRSSWTVVRRRPAPRARRRGAARSAAHEPPAQRHQVLAGGWRRHGHQRRACRTDVVISVADQGMGIPRKDQARVFERFYKVDRARQRGLGGTGLGLAIARHIVEAHGGRLWLESTEGRGSTFSFSVPARVGHRADAPRRAGLPPVSARAGPAARASAGLPSPSPSLVARSTVARVALAQG